MPTSPDGHSYRCSIPGFTIEGKARHNQSWPCDCRCHLEEEGPNGLRSREAAEIGSALEGGQGQPEPRPAPHDEYDHLRTSAATPERAESDDDAAQTPFEAGTKAHQDAERSAAAFDLGRVTGEMMLEAGKYREELLGEALARQLDDWVNRIHKATRTLLDQ